MMNLKWSCLVIGLIIIVTYLSCSDKIDMPDVSNISLTPNFIEFDEAFFNLNPHSDLSAQLEKLEDAYPNILPLYIENIMAFKKRRDTTDLYIEEIKGFLNSDLVQNLKISVDSVYPSMDDLNRQFTTAFQFLKYYFPEKPTPNIYYLIDEYSYACFLFPDGNTDGLGISLDMFLGSGFPYKQLFPTNPAFSDYLTRAFDSNYLVKKSIEAIVEDIVGFETGSQMIDQMVQNGKKQYILKKLLPATPDSILWEFTSDQMDWVRDNELNIYAFLVSEDLLYSTDHQKYKKFVNASPNSPGMPEAAPGRTANYIGYKIIEAYMNNASEKTMDRLVNNQDTQSILKQARYKPDLD